MNSLEKNLQKLAVAFVAAAPAFIAEPAVARTVHLQEFSIGNGNRVHAVMSLQDGQAAGNDSEVTVILPNRTPSACYPFKKSAYPDLTKDYDLISGTAWIDVTIKDSDVKQLNKLGCALILTKQ